MTKHAHAQTNCTYVGFAMFAETWLNHSFQVMLSLLLVAYAYSYVKNSIYCHRLTGLQTIMLSFVRPCRPGVCDIVFAWHGIPQIVIIHQC